MQGLQLLLVAGLLVLIAALAARERLGRALSQVAAFAAVAALVAAPWYAKSAVWTGNPVYPFAYSLFGGKYWSEAQAIPYQEHQLEFGVGSPPPPAERARLGLLARTFSGPRSPANLLLAPWNLVMRPTEFEVVGISPLYAVFATGIGPLFLALLPLLALSRSPRPLRWSLAFLAPSWVAWLMLMQYNRYLVPTLVFAALPVGHALAALPPSGLGRALPRVVAWTWGALALGYAVLGVWASGAWQVSLGLIGRQEYLEGRSECYRMAEWVNRVTPPDAKIALYSEPRGFYLDREYLWAEAGHSGLIDYAHIRSGADLQREFGRIGITDILYCRLPRAPDLFDLPPIGPALAELRAQGRAHVLGSPPGAPAYLLVAVDALSGAEQTSAGVGKGRR
jgi:hypothetical protein